nr:ubiquitin carboxyl-terminal hydrolase 12-like isoform X2 [Tanacetum cinerariifolium]
MMGCVVVTIMPISTNPFWIKFDDDFVTKEDMMKALDKNYGGEEFPLWHYKSPYMLVYIRETDKEKILCHVDEKDMAVLTRMR